MNSHYHDSQFKRKSIGQVWGREIPCSTFVLSRFCFPSKAEAFEGTSTAAEMLLELSLLCSVMITREPGNIIVTDSSTNAQQIPDMENPLG